MYVSELVCTECGASHDASEAQTLCRSCHMPLQVQYQLEEISERVRREDFAKRGGGMWRFKELLPCPATGIVSLGEGDTPLLELARLGEQLGFEKLLLKDEGQNPTGSFKARGLSAAVTMARAYGAKTLCAPSAGNAGAALASYGARAGLHVRLFMPRDVPRLHRIVAQQCAASVELVEGTISDCGHAMQHACTGPDCFPLSTLKEPWRVEGKKTMGLELAEALAWTLPDVILYPTGGGTGLVGMHKAFGELLELGFLEEGTVLPRMVAVQADGCAPIVDAFFEGRDHCDVPEDPQTVASGLRVPGPIGDRWMLRVLRETKGSACKVLDKELLAGARALAEAEGLFVAPEAGALVAALPKLREQGFLSGSERIVLFATGSGLAYPDCFDRM